MRRQSVQKWSDLGNIEGRGRRKAGHAAEQMLHFALRRDHQQEIEQIAFQRAAAEMFVDGIDVIGLDYVVGKVPMGIVGNGRLHLIDSLGHHQADQICAGLALDLIDTPGQPDHRPDDHSHRDKAKQKELQENRSVSACRLHRQPPLQMARVSDAR
jgi:hypothetical protein